MRIKFNKLQTRDGKINITFDSDTYTEYNVSDIANSGVDIPDTCTDYSLIKIRGSSKLLSNLDVLSKIRIADTSDKFVPYDILKTDCIRLYANGDAIEKRFQPEIIILKSDIDRLPEENTDISEFCYVIYKNKMVSLHDYIMNIYAKWEPEKVQLKGSKRNLVGAVLLIICKKIVPLYNGGSIVLTYTRSARDLYSCQSVLNKPDWIEEDIFNSTIPADVTLDIYNTDENKHYLYSTNSFISSDNFPTKFMTLEKFIKYNMNKLDVDEDNAYFNYSGMSVTDDGITWMFNTNMFTGKDYSKYL